MATDTLLYTWIEFITREKHLFSAPESFKFLTPENADRIVSLVKRDENVTEKLVQLMGKRDEISYAIGKLLNDLAGSEIEAASPSAEVGDVGHVGVSDGDTNVVPNDSSNTHGYDFSIQNGNSTMSQPGDNEISKLDPTTIRNRELAQRFLTEMILSDRKRKGVIWDLINKQSRIEAEWFEARQKLVDNSNEHATLGTDLTKFDEQFYQVLEKFTRECFQKFKKLKVPFFCLRKEYHYPNLKEDRKFIISTLTAICVENDNAT